VRPVEYQYKPADSARMAAETAATPQEQAMVYADKRAPRIGIIAQDLERSPAFDDSVVETPAGKAVQRDRALSTALAELGGLDKRLRELEAIGEDATRKIKGAGKPSSKTGPRMPDPETGPRMPDDESGPPRMPNPTWSSSEHPTRMPNPVWRPERHSPRPKAGSAPKPKAEAPRSRYLGAPAPAATLAEIRGAQASSFPDIRELRNEGLKHEEPRKNLVNMPEPELEPEITDLQQVRADVDRQLPKATRNLMYRDDLDKGYTTTADNRFVLKPDPTHPANQRQFNEAAYVNEQIALEEGRPVPNRIEMAADLLRGRGNFPEARGHELLDPTEGGNVTRPLSDISADDVSLLVGPSFSRDQIKRELLQMRLREMGATAL